MPLSTHGGRRSKGARETGEKGAFEISGGEREREGERGREKGERYTWEERGEPEGRTRWKEWRR